MAFDLIALDMDGTLLDSTKHVLVSSTEAIEAALDANKVVAVSSGRCPTMVSLYASELGRIRYAICSSGATLYDLVEDEVLEEMSMEAAHVTTLVDAARNEEVVLSAATGKGFLVDRTHIEAMGRVGMASFIDLYLRCGTPVDDIWTVLLESGRKFQKLNFHFATPEASNRLLSVAASLPLEIAAAEGPGLEISPRGANKGAALLSLARRLEIPPASTIAVGDSDNDLDMLRAAGLGLAMANANESARVAADVVLALDNDHGGIAEAIYTYLL